MDFETLTLAIKAEVPLLFNAILTLHTSINGSSRICVIPFAVAILEDVILGTPFFEKYVKTLNIEHVSFKSNTPHESHITSLRFTAHKEKDNSYFSYIYTIKVKKIILNTTLPKVYISQFNLLFL